MILQHNKPKRIPTQRTYFRIRKHKKYRKNTKSQNRTLKKRNKHNLRIFISPRIIINKKITRRIVRKKRNYK